jgi:multiple sugar transport system ATP-binding protein
MTLADRVVVLRDGAIEQVGSPLALYDKPANQFVAQFIGTPQMNILDTALLPALAGVADAGQAAGAAAAPGELLGVRPEAVLVRPAGQGRLSGRVELIESLGSNTLIHTRLDTATGAAAGAAASGGVQLVAAQNARSNLRVGDAVGLDLVPGALHWFNRQGHAVACAQ